MAFKTQDFPDAFSLFFIENKLLASFFLFEISFDKGDLLRDIKGDF